MILASKITKRYGTVKALDSVSFKIEAGESIALWGANGAGKTTAIRCLLGVHNFEGNLRVDNIDVQQEGKKARSLIGYVPQEMAFFDMSVLETLQFYARLKKVNPEQISAALETVQLVGHNDKAVKALSGGMKQRLALAIALLTDPPILLLDEPTASLDAGAQRDFIKLIRSLNHGGKTIVFSSHRFEEVAALANQVIVLEGGKLRSIYSPSELAVELGLRQWLRIEVADDFRSDACEILHEKGYNYVPNGSSVYVNIQQDQRMNVLRTLENGEIPVLDFDITDSYAVPSQEVESC
jgi:ABC-type multidrug transport system ATPase subunit